MSDQKDNTRLFHKIVRDFNNRTGYRFKLPEDTDYSSKYAHPVHDDGVVVITSQIDDDEKPDYADLNWKKEPYALSISVDGVRFYADEFKSYGELKEVIDTKEFKTRLNAIKEINKTLRKLTDLHLSLTNSIVSDTIGDLQRERIYDEMTAAAKLVYELAEADEIENYKEVK